jgi:hypothetical protein
MHSFVFWIISWVRWFDTDVSGLPIGPVLKDQAAQSGPGPPFLGVSRSNPMTHHSRQDSSGWGIGLPQETCWISFYSLLLCLYFICTCLFVLIVLHFAFFPYCTTHTTQTSMFPLGFEPAIPAGERPQTLALDRSATGSGERRNW